MRVTVVLKESHEGMFCLEIRYNLDSTSAI